jgi:hypothetical protein
LFQTRLRYSCQQSEARNPFRLSAQKEKDVMLVFSTLTTFCFPQRSYRNDISEDTTVTRCQGTPEVGSISNACLESLFVCRKSTPSVRTVESLALGLATRRLPRRLLLQLSIFPRHKHLIEAEPAEYNRRLRFKSPKGLQLFLVLCSHELNLKFNAGKENGW